MSTLSIRHIHEEDADDALSHETLHAMAAKSFCALSKVSAYASVYATHLAYKYAKYAKRMNNC